MMVYGDREVVEVATTALSEVRALVASARHANDSQRLGAIVTVIVELGRLVQGLLDSEFQERGVDELSACRTACQCASRAAARALVVALDGVADTLDDLERATAALASFATTQVLTLREPEGYAYYALYPELYARAACTISQGPPVQVIGIRSIGCSLADVVAAALGSSLPVHTVRPVGHPFARELRIGHRLEQELLQDASSKRYAVVDEGPGLSGSSFAAVQRFLTDRGVAARQIELFPSHAGEPGEQASEHVRASYRNATRHVCSFEAYFREPVLARWFEPEIGIACALRDLGAGRWRGVRFPQATEPPPSYARDERRKLLLESERGSFLMKFSGLGSRSLQRRCAQALSDARLTPTLIAVRHGFSLSKFERTTRCWDDAPRSDRITQLGRYLSFRTRALFVDAQRGASSRALLQMLVHNARELLGAAAGESARRFELALDELSSTARYIAVDGKLEPYEWLLLEDGRLLKCDADEHCAAHDCIGCQDAAWDLAGAVIELGCDQEELERLRAALWDGARYRASDGKLRFYRAAYAAFRAGRAHYGELSVRGWAEDDAQRIRLERQRYVTALERELTFD